MTSTAGDAALSASTATLTNGAFSLAQPVAITPAKTTWSGPVSNDVFAIAFKQSIGGGRAAADRRLQRERDVHAVDHDPVEQRRVGRPAAAAGARRPSGSVVDKVKVTVFA